MNGSSSDAAAERALEDETALATRAGLPASQTWLRELFAAQPWRDHPNYAGLASFWQQVHNGIRAEAVELRRLLEKFRNHDSDAELFQRALTGRLQQYLGHLQFHHQIEDESYFPKFRALDEKLASGFDLLEADHQVIHAELMRVGESGGLLVRSLRSPSEDVKRHLATHAEAAERLSRLLDRHLDDEEDLVVPAILRHGDRSLV